MKLKIIRPRVDARGVIISIPFQKVSLSKNELLNVPTPFCNHVFVLFLKISIKE